jgi:hypothetical protein
MDHYANTSLAGSSRTLYNKKLQQFIAMMPEPQKQTLDYIVDNPEAASEILKSSATITQTSANRHMFYSAVVAYLKHTANGKQRSERLQNRWLTIQKENWEERRQASLDNTPSENQMAVATSISWQQVITMRNTLPKGSLEKLLLSVYTYIPPVRADYYEMRINPKQSEINAKTNFIQLTNSQQTSVLVIRDFKTAAKYKEIKHTIPQPLYDEIVASLQAKPRNYLFTMPTDTARPYDRGSFSKWANKVLSALFKVPMTLTSLRHMYVSTLDFNNTRAKDLERIGNSMGHSISMQKGYQWIPSESNINEII